MSDNLDLLPTWEFGNVLGRLPVGDERVAECKRIIKANEAALRYEISSLVSALKEIRDTVNDPREIAIRALERHAKGGKE